MYSWDIIKARSYPYYIVSSSRKIYHIWMNSLTARTNWCDKNRRRIFQWDLIRNLFKCFLRETELQTKKNTIKTIFHQKFSKNRTKEKYRQNNFKYLQIQERNFFSVFETGRFVISTQIIFFSYLLFASSNFLLQEDLMLNFGIIISNQFLDNMQHIFLRKLNKWTSET